MDSGWEVPPGYPDGIEQKIISGRLDEEKRRGIRTRLLRFKPGARSTETFVHEYWEEVHTTKGRIILDPGAFYILVSREAVHIPPDYAAEMAPYLAMVGEFRVHYAGFFDPGFGHDAAGGAGSRGVLEVRCHEAPFVLEHAQVVGRLVYERMTERPSQIYGAGIASNYQGQGLKLSKHFKV